MSVICRFLFHSIVFNFFLYKPNYKVEAKEHIELSLHEYSYIPPTPKRPSTLNEGHIWMISWNFNNFIWWNELKNIRVLFHKAAVYLTWLGNFFLHDHKKNDKMAADGKKSKKKICSFIFINEFVKIRYGSISCYYYCIIAWIVCVWNPEAVK